MELDQGHVTFINTILPLTFSNFSLYVSVSDKNNNFTKTIFYGQEVTLQTFAILLFAVSDLAFQNYVLAGVITYIVDAVRLYWQWLKPNQKSCLFSSSSSEYRLSHRDRLLLVVSYRVW